MTHLIIALACVVWPTAAIVIGLCLAPILAACERGTRR